MTKKPVVQVIPLGVGSSFSTTHYYANMLLIVDGRRIHIDCPAYLLRMLRDYRERFQDPAFRIENCKEVIITHNHEDHVAGVEELGYMSARGRPKKPKLYSTREILTELWEESLIAGLRWRMEGREFVEKEFNDYFKPIPLQLGEPNDMGGFQLEIRHAFHMPRTIALKFVFGDYKFGYSSDTGFMSELFKWWDDCQFVIHEVFFGADIAWHTSLESLLTLPRNIQKRIYLNHYTDDYLDHDIGSMQFLHEGKVYHPFES